MNMTTTPAFSEFQTGITEALEDLQTQIQDAADLIHAHLTLYKRAASKGRHA